MTTIFLFIYLKCGMNVVGHPQNETNINFLLKLYLVNLMFLEIIKFLIQ